MICIASIRHDATALADMPRTISKRSLLKKNFWKVTSVLSRKQV